MAPHVDNAIALLAKRDHVSKATKISQLLRVALEVEEDDALYKLASERDLSNASFVSHEDAWK